MKLIIITFLFLFSAYNLSTAQTAEIDSINRIISKKGETASGYYKYGKYEEAEKISKDILDLKLKYFSSNLLNLTVNYINLGSIYNTLARYDEALKNYLKALEIIETNEGREKVLYYGTG